jgi:hypothetical protein
LPIFINFSPNFTSFSSIFINFSPIFTPPPTHSTHTHFAFFACFVFFDFLPISFPSFNSLLSFNPFSRISLMNPLYKSPLEIPFINPLYKSLSHSLAHSLKTPSFPTGILREEYLKRNTLTGILHPNYSCSLCSLFF